MKIVCDSCSTKYSIADEKVRGKVFKIKCKKCSHIIVVKGDAEGGAPVASPFEQKETKVFDYAGFDGKDAGPANPPPGEPVWHLVIDREQVGPLTVEEVRQRWSAGEIDAETYAWREGFGDWLRIAAIDELAQAAPTTSHAAAADDVQRRDSIDERRDEPRDGGYDPPRPATGPTVRSDPADLFAAAAASAMDDETSGPELFAPRKSGGGANDGDAGVYASTPAASPRAAWGREPVRGTPSPKHDPFEHAEMASAPRRSTGGMAASAGAEEVDVRPMTGQRNENSVLFSLNNLASMASDSNGAARSSAPSSFPSTGGTEGSGLIDIRAMAAMTLGTKRTGEDRPRASGTSDDLPVFSASSYSTSNAGVLLPTVTAQGSNKIVYIFIGLVGVLAVAAITLVLVIVLGKKEPVVAAPVATVAGDHGATPGSPSGSDPGSAAPSPAAPNAGAPASAPAGNGSPSVQPASAPAAVVQPGTAENNPPAPQPAPAKPVHPAVTPPRHPDNRHVPAGAAHPAEPTPPPTPAARPTPPPGEIPKPTAPQKCDEIACMVTPDLPCCPKKGGSARPGAAIPSVSPSGGDPNLPDKLDQPAIIDGMKSVTGRVMACNDQFHVAGAFKIAITVSPNGDVTGATATPPIGGTGAGTCAERAVHGARFKKTKNSITFKYPFTFH